MKPEIWIVIPCAGKGKRFGASTPKQYQSLLNKTVLEQTLSRFLMRDDVAGIVLAVAADDEWIAELPELANVHRVEGGAERADSVLNALGYLKSTVAGDVLVAVHDAARPCVRQQDLDRVFSCAAESEHGALLALPATDTIKRVTDGKVDRTLDRRQIYMAQTPQVFSLKLLHAALSEAAEKAVTDDASAMELAGFTPQIVIGHSDNIKITQQQDLQLAEFYLRNILEEND